MRWSISDIADAIEAGLRARAAADDAEQAVYGFDTLAELDLHPLLQQALRTAGFGVWPEQRYPSDRERGRKSEGKRCDIVLTPAPPVGEEPLPVRDPELRGTLFEGADACDPEDAYWLEVKTVAQHETTGPFARYAAELLAPVAHDVRKLWSDPLVHHGGLLIVLFTAEPRVAEHDLMVWHERCLQKGFPVGPPALRGVELTDRVGNAWCQVAVFGVRGV